jgi:CheY-like chemotaxis protein
MALRLLIVDDNRDNADSLDSLLRREGFDVRVAYEGQQAINAALSFHPDVLIVDLAMPIMDGFQVVKQLRAMPEFEHSIFIALSAYSDQPHLDEASKVEFDEYLFKPPKMGPLLAILSEVTERVGK